MSTVKNNTCNGQCSRCGECCMPVLPLTIDEINTIKDYIKKNNIKMNNPIRKDGIHFTCPFYNFDEHKCDIYEVRPEVCREFLCGNPTKIIKKNKYYYDKRADINGTHWDRLVCMDLLFYGSPFLTLILIKDKLNPKDETDLLRLLYNMGKDQKFLQENKINNTFDVAKGIMDGEINLEWSDK